MQRIEVSKLYENLKEYMGKEVSLSGWIRTIRDSKNIGFIELNDGSSFKNIQIVIDESLKNFNEVIKYTLSSSVEVLGEVVASSGGKQEFEIKAKEVKLLGHCAEDYPLQKKRHTMEYLRTITHLRPRTNTFKAVFRIRSLAAQALHQFFSEREFVYVHAPIITTSDCEGAGEMFQVTTLDLENVPKDDKGNVDYNEDFFNKKSYLTVSGQLDLETFAMSFDKTYTFGPTFRAENSNTTRHAAEFWMVEPEIAFADLNDNMALAEDMVKYVINYVLEKAPSEYEFLNEFIEKGLIDRLERVRDAEFGKVTYTEAVEILEKCGKEFQFKPYWGCDLQTEHERFLSEEHFKKPVFVTDYPKDIKSFYMKLNDDGKTVAAMDMLVPGIGELVGGSQREENYEKLLGRINEMGLNKEDYEWYLDIRRYGSVVHSGYGIGFERLIMYLTGIGNIRDVLPFPRTVHNAGN